MGIIIKVIVAQNQWKRSEETISHTREFAWHDVIPVVIAGEIVKERLGKLDMFTTILLNETPQQKHKQLARTYYLIAQVRMLYLVPRMSWDEHVDHETRKKHTVDKAKQQITKTLSNPTNA